MSLMLGQMGHWRIFGLGLGCWRIISSRIFAIAALLVVCTGALDAVDAESRGS